MRTLNDQLERFWNIEEHQPKKFLMPNEQACEEYFWRTTRQEDGRYVVRLPKDMSCWEILKNSPYEESTLWN